jgi:Holliday junction resolvase RusA-like endonuclease
VSEPVRFVVPGAVPAKSNYRWSNTERGKRSWKRIREYQMLVGLLARKAGAKPRPGFLGSVEVTAFGQRCDPDNTLKCIVDGLRGVAFPDDSPEYVERVSVESRPDDGSGKRVEVTVRYGVRR